MRRVPLAFALAFGCLATALHARPASVAEHQPIVIAQAATPPLRSDTRSRTVDDFFRDFTAEWVRTSPDLARRTRYLTGEERDRLERQLTPWTEAWRWARIALARSGLAELRSLDRASMSDAQRLSADVMQSQLQAIIDGEPYYDDSFPLNQFRGANVSLVDALVVVQPLRTVRDAENYVAALAQVATRMEEAMAESRRRAANGVLPPNFIVRATIAQMRGFIAPPPAQNPFVATFAQKIAAISALPDQQRAQLQAQAEQIVQSETRNSTTWCSTQAPCPWRFWNARPTLLSRGSAGFAAKIARAGFPDPSTDRQDRGAALDQELMFPTTRPASPSPFGEGDFI